MTARVVGFIILLATSGFSVKNSGLSSAARFAWRFGNCRTVGQRARRVKAAQGEQSGWSLEAPRRWSTLVSGATVVTTRSELL
jgi:hypothetical protein